MGLPVAPQHRQGAFLLRQLWHVGAGLCLPPRLWRRDCAGRSRRSAWRSLFAPQVGAVVAGRHRNRLIPRVCGYPQAIQAPLLGAAGAGHRQADDRLRRVSAHRVFPDDRARGDDVRTDRDRVEALARRVGGCRPSDHGRGRPGPGDPAHCTSPSAGGPGRRGHRRSPSGAALATGPEVRVSREDEERQQLLGLMLTRAFRVGDFLLTSGRRSPYYFDGRLVTLDPQGALLGGRAMLRFAREDGVTKIGGPTLGADPMVTAVALCSALDEGPDISAFIVRQETKEHGAGGWCAGAAPEPGEAVALVDDALTSGGSLLQAAEKVAASGARIVALYALLDRQEGGRERLEAAGYRTRSVFVRGDLLTADGQALPAPG